MNLRAVVLVSSVLAAACGPTSPPCSPSNCAGCCDAMGGCHIGVVREACGLGGVACDICTPEEACTLGTCISGSGGGVAQSGVGGGGGGGGGSGGAGGGGSPSVPDAGVRFSKPCAGTTVLCNGSCVDPDTDEGNCGACGRQCGAGLVCNRGLCETLPTDCVAKPCPGDFGCNPQTRTCDTRCFSNADCRAGASCVQGVCECGYGEVACGNFCAGGGVTQTCRCRAGYEGAGDCVDVDECRAGTYACSPNSHCVNETGDYRCDCDPGYFREDPYYEPDGQCIRDECAVNNGGCSPNADCDQYGTYVYCSCKPGYDGDGKSCSPVCTGSLTCADPSLACYPTSSYSGTCEPPGPGGEGARCTSNSNCQRGTRCEVMPGALSGFCAKLCQSNSGCATSQECDSPNGVNVCLNSYQAHCDPLLQNCAYGACYSSNSGDICVAYGQKGVGQPCSFANECARGTACISSVCQKFCDPYNPMCPTGTCVQVFGTSYGFCQ
ncbi:MAG: EGF domain-containing protein [Myxococcota bacterium]